MLKYWNTKCSESTAFQVKTTKSTEHDIDVISNYVEIMQRSLVHAAVAVQ